jgi:predicted nucleic acid-binding protein
LLTEKRVKSQVYIETTAISNLTVRPFQGIVVPAYQQITRDWWQSAAERFELVVSEFVINEGSAGNEEAAKKRLAVLESLTVIEATQEAFELARKLVDLGAIPKKAAEDAAHIAIAVANGIDYLVTWNCRHIANAMKRSQIEWICRKASYRPVIICTPDELMEPDDEKNNH